MKWIQAYDQSKCITNFALFQGNLVLFYFSSYFLAYHFKAVFCIKLALNLAYDISMQHSSLHFLSRFARLNSSNATECVWSSHWSKRVGAAYPLTPVANNYCTITFLIFFGLCRFVFWDERLGPDVWHHATCIWHFFHAQVFWRTLRPFLLCNW